MRPVPNKDVRAEGERLESLGYVSQGLNGNGHLRWTHPDFGTIVLAATPGDWRWRKNARAEVARQMGLTTRQVEDQMGLPRRRAGRTKFKVAEQKSESWITHLARLSVKPIPEVAEVLSPEDRMEQIAAEIQEAGVKCNLAIPGSDTYEKTLDRIAALRGEYAQIETDRKAA